MPAPERKPIDRTKQTVAGPVTGTRTQDSGDRQQELLDQIAEEFSERCRRGQQPSIQEYVQRFPSLADKLQELLPSVVLMEQLKRNRRPQGAVGANGQRLERLGDYRILREVGRGGMGIVYEARQESLDRRVALKVLPRHSLLDPKRLARFRVEAQAAARMHHTNIVPVFGLFESDGLYYYAMQFIEGQGLDQVLSVLKQGESAKETRGTRRNKKSTRKITQSKRTLGAIRTLDTVPADSQPQLPGTPPAAAVSAPARLPVAVGPRPVRSYWDQVAVIGMQVADALQYAHDQGALHRDIKPANLLLDGRGTVWVTDFGLAKLLEHDNLTSTGDVIGTLQYMAPESIHGESDARSDVYSLGLTLYELLTLQAPFDESNPALLLKMVTEAELPPPRRQNPAIPHDLETIVLKAVSRDPDHRYASARQLGADLRRFLDDRPIKARRVALVERTWRWCRRNRLLAALTIVAGNSLLLAAVLGSIGYATTASALKLANQHLAEAKLANQRASQHLADAKAATQRAEDNMQLSLGALQEIFAALAERQKPSATKAGSGKGKGDGPRGGASGGPPEPPPNDHRAVGAGGPQDGHKLPPPPGAEGGPEHRRREPPRDKDESDAALLQTVLRFYDRFAEMNAADPKLQLVAAEAYNRVAELHNRLGRTEQAAEAFGRAAQLCETLRKDSPQDPRPTALLADVKLRWGGMESQAAEPSTPEATDKSNWKQRLARVQEAESLIAGVVAQNPRQFEYVNLQGEVNHALGDLARLGGDQDTAQQRYRRAIEIRRALLSLESVPHNKLDHLIEDLYVMQKEYVDLLCEQNRTSDARTFLEASAAELEKLPVNRRARDALADVYIELADLYDRMGEADKADAMDAKAEALQHHGPPERSHPPDGRPPVPPDRPPPDGPHHGPGGPHRGPGGHHGPDGRPGPPPGGPPGAPGRPPGSRPNSPPDSPPNN